MAPWQALLLVPAGVGAGLTGSVAGLASLVSYPALLAVGLGPVAANVTNTVALVFNTVGSVTGSRPELTGQRARALRIALAGVVGGVLGALLLLATPPGSFRKLVPVLIAFGSLAVLVPRRRELAAGTSDTPRLLVAVVLISIYGGYFGAAAGVLMLALFLNATADALPRANALKNVVLGSANCVAAILFSILAPVDWVAVLPLAAGCLLGSRLGPVVVRHAPAGPIRVAICLAGLGLAVSLGLSAYR